VREIGRGLIGGIILACIEVLRNTTKNVGEDIRPEAMDFKLTS